MMRQQGPGKLYTSSCKVFDSKSHCLQLRHFVPPNKPVSNNCLTTIIPTAIRTGRKFKKKEIQSMNLNQIFQSLIIPICDPVSLWSIAIFHIWVTSCLSCCLIDQQTTCDDSQMFKHGRSQKAYEITLKAKQHPCCKNFAKIRYV